MEEAVLIYFQEPVHDLNKVSYVTGKLTIPIEPQPYIYGHKARDSVRITKKKNSS
jgi:hypothetical protein